MSDMNERISIRLSDGTRAKLADAMARYRRRTGKEIDLSGAVRIAVDHLCFLEAFATDTKEKDNG